MFLQGQHALKRKPATMQIIESACELVPQQRAPSYYRHRSGNTATRSRESLCGIAYVQETVATVNASSSPSCDLERTITARFANSCDQEVGLITGSLTRLDSAIRWALFAGGGGGGNTAESFLHRPLNSSSRGTAPLKIELVIKRRLS